MLRIRDVATNITKIETYLILNWWRKNLGQFTKNCRTFYTKIVLKVSKIWLRIRDPGSGENLFRIPDQGVKKAPDPGSVSATLFTRWRYCPGGPRGEEHVPGWRGLLHPPPASTRQPGRAQEHGELPQGLHSAGEGNYYFLFQYGTYLSIGIIAKFLGILLLLGFIHMSHFYYFCSVTVPILDSDDSNANMDYRLPYFIPYLHGVSEPE